MAHVLIAGGGIGGLTAALHLHQNGHEVDVYESVVTPRELGVGINVLPHSVRVLDDLVACCKPKWMEVVLDYRLRGGIHTTVTVEHGTRSSQGLSS